MITAQISWSFPCIMHLGPLIYTHWRIWRLGTSVRYFHISKLIARAVAGSAIFSAPRSTLKYNPVWVDLTFLYHGVTPQYKTSAVASPIIGGGGAYSYIRVLPDGFLLKAIVVNMNIWIYTAPQLSRLATALYKIVFANSHGAYKYRLFWGNEAPRWINTYPRGASK
jgi:hypothetical protein